MPPYSSSMLSQPKPCNSERMLRLGAGLATLAIVAIVAFLLVRERADTEQAAVRASRNVVQLINNDVLRNAGLYETALQGLIDAVQDPGLASVPPSLRRQTLFDRAITAPFRGDLLWVDAAGDVRGDSVSNEPRHANFANDPSFIAHRNNLSSAVTISPPFKDRMGDLGWCISFSRRISAASGEFLGVATGALRLAYFDDLFKSLNLGENSTVSLISLDGILLARQPELPGRALVGQDISHRPNFQRFLQAGQGSFSALSSQDRIDRLYTFSRVGNLPLLVVVAQSAEVVYAPWRRTALLIGSATGLLCLGILWLTLLLGRELRLRHRAEAELATLASTDSLTGLANRRSLDLHLHKEWSRALRLDQSLSVLMIDVDHFKAFNERHGHQGGDEALRNVAAAIHSSIRRPTDIAARYGGEEFLVILPDTPLSGAQLIAEHIRRAVELQPPFANDQRPTTVSIGIGCQRIRAGRTVGNLLNEADMALYQAKHRGRNQVSYTDARIES
ncbi:sensor domain-containing diguanylate cyclase [Pseudomonas sp. HR96]|uniref:GGDEF domain-containing protein n=1 Tax=Pseudomonas sp. HR96 TaxID=1027966 RepID=UPI002A7619CF|nr:sensor domain-containing diguanylate cyclase [Pseudomonas sp. HR96]WPP00787.1 sensor domain-containing diguanylate cyclase [Pseudomonas sp. HR96]